MNQKNDYSGGSVAFIYAKNSYVHNCSFNHNRGSSGGLKIYNDFNENSRKSKTKSILENFHKTILISDCNFELNDASKNSIYYVNGKDGNMINILQV